MNIVVTGWAGFVGSHLCNTLISQWHQVICVDNLYTWSLSNISKLKDNPNFQFINHNIVEPLELSQDIDQIYNLACPASPPHYQKDPLYTTKTSVFGIINMLELAKKHNAVLLQASTSEVYGDPEQHPQSENYRGCVNPIGIRSCYDEGKRMAESICFDYNRMHGTRIKVIRIFNTYGPNMDPNDGRVVSNFITQALHNQDLTIYGSGEQTRSFQYIDDLINGMTAMMNNSSDFCGPVNIGTSFEFSMKELAEIILKLIPQSTSKIIYTPLPADDPKQRKADNTLAKEQLGREPKIALEEWLKKTIEYFAHINS